MGGCRRCECRRLGVEAFALLAVCLVDIHATAVSTVPSAHALVVLVVAVAIFPVVWQRAVRAHLLRVKLACALHIAWIAAAAVFAVRLFRVRAAAVAAIPVALMNIVDIVTVCIASKLGLARRRRCRLCFGCGWWL